MSANIACNVMLEECDLGKIFNHKSLLRIATMKILSIFAGELA